MFHTAVKLLEIDRRWFSVQGNKEIEGWFREDGHCTSTPSLSDVDDGSQSTGITCGFILALIHQNMCFADYEDDGGDDDDADVDDDDDDDAEMMSHFGVGRSEYVLC